MKRIPTRRTLADRDLARVTGGIVSGTQLIPPPPPPSPVSPVASDEA